MFTKQAMETELTAFIGAYLQSVQRIFELGGAIQAGELDPREQRLFRVCSDLYDFAFKGIIPATNELQQLNEESMIDGYLADIELFLQSLERPNPYQKYFWEEDGVQPPSMAVKTVQAAVARYVLYGGERYTTPEELGSSWTSLSFQDLALLADMDEKSVRNAANPKVNDPLITQTSGRRTWISRADAYTWLKKRRGFIPTQGVQFREKAE